MSLLLLGGENRGNQTDAGAVFGWSKSLHACCLCSLEKRELTYDRLLGICGVKGDDDGMDTFECRDETGVARVVYYSNFGC